MIRVEHLYKNFGQLEVLKDISTTIKKGEVIAIIGPSGSGKSTFLRCFNLLEEPTKGAIYIEGKNLMDDKTDIEYYKKRCGNGISALQSFPSQNCFGKSYSCTDESKKCKKDEIEAKAFMLLEKVGLKRKSFCLSKPAFRRTKTKNCNSKSSCYGSESNSF